ncbi:MAG: hypothetical protein WAM69_18610 [Candidatus Sulfotelmatobacter sp.]
MALGTRTSTADLHPAWIRWLIPSVGDLIFVALLGVLVFTNLSVRLLGDAGIGWHIRTGQLILRTHAVPRVDPFSSTMSGRPWFAWEWLYDVVVGWLDSVAGLNGVVLFTALLIATVFAGTFRWLLRRGTNVLLALVMVLLAASAAMIHFLARPHVVSWLFTVAWLWILESSQKTWGSSPSASSDSSPIFAASAIRSGSSWLLWLLPPLMLVWVNVHGGFLVGFVLLAIYAFGAAWQWLRFAPAMAGGPFGEVLRKIGAARRLRALALTGILCGLATLVNPYGFHLYVHLYRYLSNRFLMNHIDEFQSPNFHYVAQKCFAVLLLLTLVALAAKRRAASATQGLVVLFAVWSALYASRNIPVSSLLLIVVIGPWLSDAMQGLAHRRIAIRWRGLASTTFLQRMEAIEFRLRGHLWVVAAIVLTCSIAARGGKLRTWQLMDAHFSPKRFPVEAVTYLEQQQVPGPLVSTDYWGGYLIYRLYPRVRMVIDDRHDFYGEEFLKSYLKMVHVEPGWQDFLQQHQAHCVVAPRDSALTNILLETSGWQPIYRDAVAVVFVHTPATP